MCYNPVRAMTQDFGRPLPNPEGDLLLPCGKCYECISSRACDWALRCQHELGDHDDNCFLTLTYDDEHYPPSLALHKRGFQLFLKRLRKRFKKKILYLVSHEFGSKTQRMHHHAIIFGLNFSDQVPAGKSPRGYQLYKSAVCASLWQYGYHTIGEANAKTAYYIARYALKSAQIESTNSDGEIITYRDCMDVSKKPAIGYNYLERNHRRLAESGERLPRYYQKKLKSDFPESFEIYEANQASRQTDRVPRTADNIFAKYIITTTSPELDSFRDERTDPLRSRLYKNHLKSKTLSSS